MEKQKINVKKVLEYQDAVSYIEDLAKDFRSGTIVVRGDGEHMALTPSARVTVKVEAKVKDDKRKIAFELSWTEPSGTGDTAPAPAVRPEAGTPATKPEAGIPAARTPAPAPAKTDPARPPAKSDPKPAPANRPKAGTPAKKSAPKKPATGK